MKIAIVDDEIAEVDRLESYILQYANATQQSFTIFKYHNGLEFFDSTVNFDIVFFDIEMPLMNGMETAERLREGDRNCVIIFITNLARYAVQGYAVEALDFIVKPVVYNTFAGKFKRALEVAEKRAEKKVLIAVSNGRVSLSLNEIIFVECEKHKITWHTVFGDYVSWGTLKEVASRLDNKCFSFCNGSQIVNLEYVFNWKNDEVELKKGNRRWVLQISRMKKKEFLYQLTVGFGAR